MQDVVLSAEELRLFEAFYQRRLAESGGARDDADELDIARDILLAVVNDGLTPTAEGGESFIRRGAMDWSDPNAIVATQATSSSSSSSAGGNGAKKSKAMAVPGGRTTPKELIQGVLMLVAGLAAALWFFWPAQGTAGKDNVKETPVAEATTEASAEATVTPIPTLQSELLSDIVDAGVKTSLVVPRTLEVKGVSFVVQPVQIKAGDWSMPDDERAVSWVYGTVINYAFGMESTPDNKALLSSLKAGDTIVLRMSTGPVYRFAFADVIRVSPQASEIFRQNRPGMTIALLGDEEAPTRIVVRALYLPESDLGTDFAAPTKMAGMGETVVLGDTFRLTPLTSQLVELPGMGMPGYVYLAMNYAVENKSGLPMLTSAFIHNVKAGGMTYAAVPVPPQAGSKLPYPSLPESLQASQVFTTATIYAIPEAGLSENMVWSFAPDPVSGESVEVTLPALNTQLAQVTVQGANFQDGTLALTFYIQSAGRDIQLTANDIKIEGGLLSPIGNFFPWQLPMGTSRELTLLVSPSAPRGRLVVSLLKQAFEVTY